MCGASLAFVPILFIIPVFIAIAVWSVVDHFNKSFADSGQYGGHEVKYRYNPGNRKRRPQLALRLPLRTRHEFEVVEESAMDRFFKGLGFSKEIQTGDAAFDGRFYLLTESVDFTRHVFADPEARRITASLFDAGYTRLACTKRALELTAVNYPAESSSQTRDIDKGGEALARFTAFVGQNPAAGHPAPDSRTIQVVIAYAVPLLIFAVFNVLYVLNAGYFTAGSFWETLKLSLPFAAVYALLAGGLVSGRARAHRDWMVVALVSFGGIIGFFYQGAEYLNRRNDVTPAIVREMTIIDKWRGRKSSRGVVVTIDGHQVSVQSYALYHACTPGSDVLRLPLHAGSMGRPWSDRFPDKTDLVRKSS